MERSNVQMKPSLTSSVAREKQKKCCGLTETQIFIAAGSTLILCIILGCAAILILNYVILVEPSEVAVKTVFKRNISDSPIKDKLVRFLRQNLFTLKDIHLKELDEICRNLIVADPVTNNDTKLTMSAIHNWRVKLSEKIMGGFPNRNVQNFTWEHKATEFIKIYHPVVRVLQNTACKGLKERKLPGLEAVEHWEEKHKEALSNIRKNSENMETRVTHLARDLDHVLEYSRQQQTDDVHFPGQLVVATEALARTIRRFQKLFIESRNTIQEITTDYLRPLLEKCFVGGKKRDLLKCIDKVTVESVRAIGTELAAQLAVYRIFKLAKMLHSVQESYVSTLRNGTRNKSTTVCNDLEHATIMNFHKVVGNNVFFNSSFPVNITTKAADDTVRKALVIIKLSKPYVCPFLSR